jgi:hypothetical protein
VVPLKGIGDEPIPFLLSDLSFIPHNKTMKRRPWILVVLAVVHILAPIGNLLINAYWAHMSFWHYIHLFFQPANFERQWVHIIVPMVAGVAIYLCRFWSFWVYLFCMCLLFTFSYFGYLERAGSVSLVGLIVVYVANIVVVGYFLVPAVRVVYMDPRLRWWQTKPRYRADIKARFRDIAGADLIWGTVSNFSEGGLFIKADTMPVDRSMIQVLFDYGGDSYEFSGEVILHKQRATQGFGVKFLDHPMMRQRAKRVADELDAQGFLIKDRERSSDDDFMHWLRRLLKTGKGIFPEQTKKS